MSQFFSDFLTLTTCTAVGAALFLMSQGPDSIVRADGAVEEQKASLVARLDIPDQDIAKISEVVAPATEVEEIQPARLLDVSFTEADRRLPQAGGPRAFGNMGVVTGNSVNLRSGPGTGFPVAGRGRLNQQFTVTGVRDGIWIQIIDENQFEPVWIHGNYFEAPS